MKLFKRYPYYDVTITKSGDHVYRAEVDWVQRHWTLPFGLFTEERWDIMPVRRFVSMEEAEAAVQNQVVMHRTQRAMKAQRENESKRYEMKA